NDRGMRAEITGNRRNRITKMECGLVLRSSPGGPPPLINGGGASEGPSALPRLRLRRAEEDERNSRDWYPIYREIRGGAHDPVLRPSRPGHRAGPRRRPDAGRPRARRAPADG